MGKDSREKVQANTKPFFEEIQQLMEHGVVFNREAQTFLGQAAKFRELSQKEQGELMADGQRKYVPVKVKIILAADMAALCAIIGHGCAGHHYCAHCMAHSDERHLPYALVTTEEKTTFQAMAHKYDMHPRTLYAINARKDHKGVQNLTREGLSNSTALDAAARAAAQVPEAVPEVAGPRRPTKKAKKVPVATSGPNEELLRKLIGWQDLAKHPFDCDCEKCVIPKGTCVRVIPRLNFSRQSEFLKQHCPALTSELCPFCALHCNMRVSEALFQQICEAAKTSTKSLRLIESMNKGLSDLGINRSYEKSKTTGNYEKVSFHGYEALALLEKGDDDKIGIERVLDVM